jgi:tight adherence protein B
VGEAQARLRALRVDVSAAAVPDGSTRLAVRLGVAGPLLPPILMAGALGSGLGPGVAVAVGLVGATAWWATRDARRRRRQREREAAVAEAVGVLVAELRAGSTAVQALQVAASAAPSDLAVAARVAQLGGDPAPALRASPVATTHSLAVAWQVSTASGAPLSRALTGVQAEVRAAAATRREVEEQLGPVRSTARVLAALPVAGLALGASLGVDPADAYVHSVVGQVAMPVGALLACAGHVWVVLLQRGSPSGPASP